MSLAGYVISPAAQADIDQIQDYLLSQSLDASRIVGDALEAALIRLAEYPFLGHQRRDLTNKPVLFWPVFSYLLVYRPETRPVELVRVVHASREIRGSGLI